MESESLPNQEICTLASPFLEQTDLRAWLEKRWDRLLLGNYGPNVKSDFLFFLQGSTTEHAARWSALTWRKDGQHY